MILCPAIVSHAITDKQVKVIVLDTSNSSCSSEIPSRSFCIRGKYTVWRHPTQHNVTIVRVACLMNTVHSVAVRIIRSIRVQETGIGRNQFFNFDNGSPGSTTLGNATLLYNHTSYTSSALPKLANTFKA